MKTHPSIPSLATALMLITAHASCRAGSIARLVYDGISGTAVSALTNAPIFPDQPTFREQLDDYTPTASGLLVKGFQSKENSGNNFGSYIRGYLEAPQTGDYQFFIASDDASELWLSADTSPTQRRRIAFETSYGSNLFSGDRIEQRRSAPIALVRGRKYLIEVLHKQGTGASALQVGWQKPDGTREIIPGRHLAQHPLDPFLGRYDSVLAPILNATGFNAGDLPEVIAVSEGDDASVELDVIASQPTTFQWRRAGIPIPGEDLSFLSLRRVPAAWHGQTLQATVSNGAGQLTTRAAVLDVTPDRVAPSVASVEHRGNPNALTVTFSEPVTEASATLVSHLELRTAAGAIIPISSARLSSDGRTLQLTGGFNFTVDAQYQLLLRDIEDLATQPNRLSPNPTVSTITYRGDFLGPIAFDPTSPLSSVTVLENRTAELRASLRGALPWSYQWSHAGTNLPGANGAVLKVAGIAANAGLYQVSVANEFSQAQSQPITLTLQPDLIAPALSRIRGFAGLNTVLLNFDEALEPASATNILHYAVHGTSITSAALGDDGRSVTLQVAALTQGQSYLVSYIDVRDIAAASNPASGTASFVAQVDYTGEVAADKPVRFWRFNEAGGSTVASQATGLDSLANGSSTLVNSPTLGVPGLLPTQAEDGAIQFSAAASQRIAVPNGSDINATAGPWAKRSIEFWFKANSVPAPDASGLAAAAGIWEEGAATRSISVYLWRDPSNPNPEEASLRFHAYNNASDGPGAPFGITSQPAVVAQHPIRTGLVYHVVAVFDGDPHGTQGNLILYVNGKEVDRAPGVGQIYNHTGDIRIAHGNAIIHTGENGDFAYFDGVLDEFALYNTALAPTRVAAHHRAGTVANPGGALAPSVTQVATLGDPNRVLVSFSSPLATNGTTQVSHFGLTSPTGNVLPISNAQLLPGQQTVQLSGSFQLQSGTSYQLTVQDLSDTSTPPLTLSPNPSTRTFTAEAPGNAGLDPASPITSRKAFENEVVQYTAIPTGTAPFAFQWLRNGIALPGETSPHLQITATASTAGNYSVIVRNGFSSVTSANAVLSIDTDTTPPHVIAASGLAGSIHSVSLTFDEPLQTASALQPENYQLDGASIQSVSLNATGKQVTLKTSPLVSGKVYSLSISGVRDRSAAANALNTKISFAATVSYAEEVLASSPVRYWKLDESPGANLALSASSSIDPLPSTAGSYVNNPGLGAPGLVPNEVHGTALKLTAASSQRITIPNGSDINANSGPWSKRTIQLWFRANSLPAPDATGLAAVTGLWEEGGANRNIGLYLWRDPANTNPNEADLVFHAVNNVADGAGSPYGPPDGNAIFTQTRIQAGIPYHVVGVFDGDSAGFNGNLILYVNGREVGRAPGLGQIFNHTADIQIGRGNGLSHANDNGDWSYFDGVLDEIAIYNAALAPDRVAELHQIAGIIPPGFVEISSASSQLADRTVLAGQSVRFSVQASGDGPLSFQWYKDGVALPGETGPILQFVASTAQSGHYSVTVSNPVGFATSTAARLDVETHSTIPAVDGSQAIAGTVNEFRIRFVRPVDATSVIRATTFTSDSVQILAGSLSPDYKTVTLKTSPQQPGAVLKIHINGLADRETPDGQLSTTVTAQSIISYPDEVLADQPVRYYRFDEASGTNAVSLTSKLDPSATAAAILYNSPLLSVPGLIPNQAGDGAIQLVSAQSQRIGVPNGSDINISAGPWAKRTLSFWFQANNLPRGGSSPQAPVLFEEGGDSRGLAVYLYGTQDTDHPDQALLVWNAYNNAADGASGAWGVALGKATNAIYVATPIRAQTVYHVVAVLDGDPAGRNGSIRLIINGQLVGSAGGVGQIFNHSADIQIGRGSFVRHDGITAGNLHYFDGVIDDFALLNTALSNDRAAQLYQYGLSSPFSLDSLLIESAQLSGETLVLTWRGTARLESAESPQGPFSPVPGASSPHSVNLQDGDHRFFRLSH